MKPSFAKQLTILFCALFAILACTGCGGPSRKELSTLGHLIDEFRAANDEGSRQLASGKAQLGYPFILSTYEKQLEIIKKHRATHSYKGEIKNHLDTMERGLQQGIIAYKKWIDAGYDSSKPAPDELSTVNSFAIPLTESETALTIMAGR